ncbi:Predicted secreted hydrolase [Rhizobium mongolense subsp. loessense]|uniref:Predicted secreted hydrolase n=1 Tax=Rhizobium mongolense subsp. loessense TaxID=158890 RepID=A0A1G4QUJ0_9HYPH|nr:lipocalin-like domain-containing protein [Rhizobium mongolense]SCW48304.1 Predicted secreted hydrolase [Rhizobium mongolense subsp. loessense]
MNARGLLAAIVSLATAISVPAAAISQGFAGLGSTAEGFAVPRPGIQLRFPADHGPHPEFRIEWWYVTANLESEDGTRYGVQWTLFRAALAPKTEGGWSDPQVWMGHAAITAKDRHLLAEKLARGGVGQAGVVAVPFSAWIDDWEMKGLPKPGADQLDKVSLHATGKDFAYTLELSASAPLVLQGDQGYSVKSAERQASYYYSQPFYEVSGTLDIAGKTVRVSGKAWLDREWSSQPLAKDQTGWEWFSLHLDSGEKVMGFRLRDGRGGYTSANWISSDGKPTPLPPGSLQITPLRTARVGDRDVPVAWRVRIPERGFDVTTSPLNDHAWMATTTPYWEGPISFNGSAGGHGYLEMTGY